MVAILNSVLSSITAVLALSVAGVTAAPAAVQAPVSAYGFIDLGRAGSYGGLSSSGITNVGATVITGNMGTKGTSITGFPPGKVVGQTDMNNANSTNAFADYAVAFQFGQSRIPSVNKAGKTTLDGEVLVAGVYKYDSGVGLTGAMTFNGAGDSNSVWVMQIAKTLITGSASQIILSGGAKSSNIFWVVGTSATLGTYSTLHGSILAAAAITANTGSTVNGGLYAGSAVNFQSSAVTVNALAVKSYSA